MYISVWIHDKYKPAASKHDHNKHIKKCVWVKPFHLITNLTSIQNSARSVTVYHLSFRAIKFPASSRIAFQSCMLSSDASMPTFNAVSHE
jgi:hypothetical protein